MPGVLHDGVDDGGNGGVQVRIGKNDLRALATQLQCDWAVALGSNLLNQCANARAAGKADVGDAGVACQCITDFMPIAGDDVDGTRWKTCIRCELRHAQQGQTSIFRRLDHAHIAGGQGAAHAAAKNLHRVIPRDDVPRDPMRLTPGEHAVAVLVGNGFAVQFVAGTGVELQVARQRHHIGTGLLGGFAAVALFQLRQFFGVLQNLVGELCEELSALHGAELAPGRAQTVPGGIDCTRQIGAVAALDFIEGLAVGGVDNGNCLPRLGQRRRVGNVVVLHEYS